jgi:hypothetical protein
MTLSLIEARDTFAHLTPEERASLQAFAEDMDAPLDDEHLPVLLHCWRVSHGPTAPASQTSRY